MTADLEGEVSNSRLQLIRMDHPAELTKMLQGLAARGFVWRLTEDCSGQSTCPEGSRHFPRPGLKTHSCPNSLREPSSIPTNGGRPAPNPIFSVRDASLFRRVLLQWRLEWKP